MSDKEVLDEPGAPQTSGVENLFDETDDRNKIVEINN